MVGGSKPSSGASLDGWTNTQQAGLTAWDEVRLTYARWLQRPSSAWACPSPSSDRLNLTPAYARGRAL